MPQFLVLIVFVLAMPEARAQASAWIDPTGAFSLEIPSGWVQLPPNKVDPRIRSTLVLDIGPKQELSSDSGNGCSIWRLDHTAPTEVTQEMANSVLRGWDHASVSAETVAQGKRVLGESEFTNKLTDNVQTVFFAHDTILNSNRVRYSQTQFMLALGGRFASFYTVGCAIFPIGANPDVAKANAFLSSLRFLKN